MERVEFPKEGGSAPYVVGIGASAGGLEALEAFFDNVPKSSGMALGADTTLHQSQRLISGDSSG